MYSLQLAPGIHQYSNLTKTTSSQVKILPKMFNALFIDGSLWINNINNQHTSNLLQDTKQSHAQD